MLTEVEILAENIFSNVPPEERKMPKGRRPKAPAPPKKFERQEALKNRILNLADELRDQNFSVMLAPLQPIAPVAKEVVDGKYGAIIGHVEEPLAVYLQ